jgi:carbonic anhydrase
MSASEKRWLDHMLEENARFRNRIRRDKLPVQRTPGSFAVITCMDPRVNLEAIGISSFTAEGEGSSPIRVIRSIGAMAENRSLVINIFLAGIREIAVLMHTDCGCCLAFSKIDTIIENMQKNLSVMQFQQFRAVIGEPFRDNLRVWLKAFEEPRNALRREIASIRCLSFTPRNVMLHGLLYDLASGTIETVVNGYDEVAQAPSPA